MSSLPAHLAHPDLALVSSNAQKRAEFERLGVHGIALKAGLDLPEVLDPNPHTVALYKSQAAGAHTITEDTSLHIQGVDIGTNIRWQLDSLSTLTGRPARFTVLLAHNDGQRISLYEGHIDGTIAHPKEPPGKDAFGFDPYFIPQGSRHSLYALQQMGDKDRYSARAFALQALLAGEHVQTMRLEDIPTWTGAYQDEAPATATTQPLQQKLTLRR